MKRFITYLVCILIIPKSFCQNVTYVLANNEKVQSEVIRKVYKGREKFDKDAFATYIQTAFKSYFSNPQIKADYNKSDLLFKCNSLKEINNSLKKTEKELRSYINKNGNSSNSYLLSNNSNLKEGIAKIDSEMNAQRESVSAENQSLRGIRDSLISVLQEIDKNVDLNKSLDILIAAAKNDTVDLNTKISQAKRTSKQKDKVTEQIDGFTNKVLNLAKDIKNLPIDKLLLKEKDVNNAETELMAYKTFMVSCGKEATFDELGREIKTMKKYLELARSVDEAHKVLHERYSREKTADVLNKLLKSSEAVSRKNVSQKNEIENVQSALYNQERYISEAESLSNYIKDEIGCVPDDNGRDELLWKVSRNEDNINKYNYLYIAFIQQLKNKITHYKESNWNDDNIVTKDLKEMVDNLSESQ